MSDPVSAPIPAGWYPDPAGSFQQRWWTGASWTNDFAQYRPTLIHAAPAVEQIAAPPQDSSQAFLAQQAAATAQSIGASAAQQAATQTLVRETAVDPLPAFRLPDADQPPQTTVAQPNAGTAMLLPVASREPNYIVPAQGATFENDYQPFGSVPGVRRGVRERSETRFTAQVWMMPAVPPAFAASAWAIAAFLPMFYTVFAVAFLGFAFLFIGLGLAFADRRALQRAGHDATAHPALAVLTPLPYLLVRAFYVRRETGRNAIAPALVLLVGVAAVGAALALVSGLLPLLTSFTAL